MQTLINHCIQFTCNSADTEELSDDDTHVSKHVGAAEYNKKLLKYQCSSWLFINIEQKMHGMKIKKKKAFSLVLPFQLTVIE
jgi:hypothetical protein